MTRDCVISLLQLAMPELSTRFVVRHLMLFGSFARNAARPDSDVDIFVEFDQPISLFGLASLKARLEALLGRSVDIGSIDSLRPEARREIMAEALRVA